jgi:threonine dehydrogenase-like Zn-dependent dehydrogenase
MPRYGYNSSAVVQGAGLLGIYAVAWLKHMVHMSHVFVVDKNEDRLRLAEAFGGIPLRIEGDNFDDREREIRNVCPRGVDMVVEMAGNPEVVSEGVKLLRNGGHYSFVGMVHPQSQLSSVTGEQLIRKCLTIRGVHNYSPWHLDEAIHFLLTYKDKLPFDKLVPTQYPLAEINEAIAAAMSGQHGCRVAVNPSLG